jgi:hypothetical protein
VTLGQFVVSAVQNKPVTVSQAGCLLSWASRWTDKPDAAFKAVAGTLCRDGKSWLDSYGAFKNEQ